MCEKITTRNVFFIDFSSFRDFYKTLSAAAKSSSGEFINVEKMNRFKNCDFSSSGASKRPHTHRHWLTGIFMSLVRIFLRICRTVSEKHQSDFSWFHVAHEMTVKLSNFSSRWVIDKNAPVQSEGRNFNLCLMLRHSCHTANDFHKIWGEKISTWAKIKIYFPFPPLNSRALICSHWFLFVCGCKNTTSHPQLGIQLNFLV